MLTIGEFSRLSHVSARMLRHYDVLGLLHPACTGEENSYRYYTQQQLETAAKIERLKGYGFSLAEIRELLLLPEQELGHCIHRRRLKAYNQVEEMRQTIRRMEEHIDKMEGTNMHLEQYKVTLLQNPAQKVIGVRRTINITQVNELFEEALAKIKALGLTRSGPCQQVYLGEEFSYDNMDVEAQVEVSGEHPEVRTLPACTCVATVHKGGYDGLKYAYEAIGAWMAEHPEYQVSGPGIERYLTDMDSVESQADLETGVLFPVTKVK